MPKGNPNLPQLSKKGEEMELLASKFLEERDFQIIYAGVIARDESRQWRKKHGKFRFSDPSLRVWLNERHKKFELLQDLEKKLGLEYGVNHYAVSYDYLCRKGNQYFVFEVKYKIWKEGRLHFHSSEGQIGMYDEVQKKGRVQVKVLTIVEKDKKLSYNIYDWNDFEKAKTIFTLKKRSPIKIKNKNPIKLKNKSYFKDSPSLAKLLKSMMIES